MRLPRVGPLAIVTLTCLIPGLPTATTYPIGPRPLREQVKEAVLIVVAKVELDKDPPEAQPLTEQGEVDLDHAYVVLRVERILKGETKSDRIRQHNYRTECDALRYVPGTKVIAFLKGPPDAAAYGTLGMEYGVKVVDAPAEAVYAARIHELLEIQKEKLEVERRTHEREWLVRCTEESATRWEGAFELSADFEYAKVRSPISAEAKALSSSQIERLVQALVAAPKFRWGEECLESALQQSTDPRILTWLVARLRDTLTEPDVSPWTTASILWRMQHRDAREPIQQLVNEFDPDLPFATDDPSKKKLKTREAIVRKILALYP